MSGPAGIRFNFILSCPNLGKLVKDNWSKIQHGKLIEKQLTENSPAENSSPVQKIISAKYSAKFVIILCYDVLNYYEVLHCKL